MQLSYLNDEGLSGGAAANDGLRDVVALSAALVVQRRAGNGCGTGKLDHPVTVEVVLSAQVLDSWT